MGRSIQTAMIIDDDPDFSQLLTIMLEKRKTHVLAVYTLEEAQDYLTYLKPTVIFLDNSFPKGLGVNFIHLIKEIDPEIKIVMTTGDTALWIHDKAVEEGIDYFLNKPLDKKLLDNVLDKLHFSQAEA